MKKTQWSWLSALLLCFAVQANEQEGAMIWDSLLPEHERGMYFDEVNHNLPMEEIKQNLNVELNLALNNTKIRIPGFVVPLETQNEKTTEFFLVPYYGACIHYPPPPPNQIVHVVYEQGLSIDDPWQPVWVEGTIQTELHYAEHVATSGYKIAKPTSITLYVE